MSIASTSSFTERDVTLNEECNVAITTIETRESTFKNDIAMAFVYKLQTNSELFS